jgi:hypothetical protein
VKRPKTSGVLEDPRKRRRLVDQFREAWQAGNCPRVETFLPPQPASGPSAARQELLEELVAVEMEYRWRGGPRLDAGRPKLEEYLKRFPELGGPERVSMALVGAEYRARHLWGDRPGFEEYPGRFRGRSTELRTTFAKMELAISAALLAEQQPPPPPPALAPAPPTPPPKSAAAPTATAAPVATPIQDVATLLNTLRAHQLLDSPKLNELIAADSQGRLGDVRAAAKRLVNEDWLTPFQVNLILQGRAQELVLGSYVLQSRLGQGRTGQVYKAIHKTMQRAVAIKVIRKDLLTDTEAVTRFYREMNVVGQLDHPNLIHAYDAGPIGAAHILVMEYFEGASLAQLVEKGPMPVAQAADYIRQAALGLQHAHEKNLIHRNIKPQNLLVDRRSQGQRHSGSPWGALKILDMGLARLQSSGETDWSSVIKGGASVRGEGDYLAPEQALDAHTIDIRADIYSLGCVFYFLLAGRPPFPEGSLAQKLMKHQQVMPARVSAHRRDVPPQVDIVLSAMMAKQPADRYPTPGDVAAAVERLG